jgi:peroxiredoxin
MEEQSPKILEYAELLLGEDKAEEARLLLFAYLKRNPASASAWWILSRAVEDVQQERDCLERVLRLDPAHAQARARLDELKPTPASPPARSPGSSVSPFVFFDDEPKPDEKDFDPFAVGVFRPADSVPGSGQRPKPAAPAASEVPAWAAPPAPPKESGPSVQPQPAPRKKRTWVVDVMVILLVLFGLTTVVGYFIFRDIGQKMINDYQATMAVAGALTGLPTSSTTPTRTATETFTPSFTRTLTESPVPPSETPTLLYTFTKTSIPASAYGVTAGMYPPGFTLMEVATGEQVSLGDYPDHPILLFFWATWCQYCRHEITSLQAVYEAYQGDGLVVLAINLDGTTEEVSAFRSAYGLTFPILMDLDDEVSTKYKANSIPHHVFVGLNGRIMFVVTGELGYTDLENKVKATMRVFPTPTP